MRTEAASQNASKCHRKDIRVGVAEYRQIPKFKPSLNITTLAMSISPFTSVHRLYVRSLYRRMLKNELDWIVRRDIWRAKAQEIRAEFERNR